MTAYEAMIHCVKSEMNCSVVKFDLRLSESELGQLYEISKYHDLSHIVGDALIKNKALQSKSALYDKFQKKIMLAIYRYENSNYEFNEIVKLFEEKQIKFIPLKGVILRELYPAQWMRTSCDIDILIKREHFSRATQCLVDVGLKKGVESPHDISFITASGGYIEIHHSLIEDDRISNIDCVLSDVWEKAAVHDGYQYWYDMKDEMFYFYHVAHMAKHFLFGGCGIRPFIDLWILDSIQETDIEKRDELLHQGNLLKFANSARKLSRIWFSNEQYDFISQQMEDYILRGGVYGSSENRITVQQQKKGGRIRYALSKIFIPYDEIKFHYPILQKHRWLTPIMEVRRWCKLIFGGHVKRTVRELKYNNSVSYEKASSMQSFLKNIGL